MELSLRTVMAETDKTLEERRGALAAGLAGKQDLQVGAAGKREWLSTAH